MYYLEVRCFLFCCFRTCNRSRLLFLSFVEKVSRNPRTLDRRLTALYLFLSKSSKSVKIRTSRIDKSQDRKINPENAKKNARPSYVPHFFSRTTHTTTTQQHSPVPSHHKSEIMAHRTSTGGVIRQSTTRRSVQIAS